jgi:hypothetical protein
MSATIFDIDVTGLQTPDVNDNLSAAHIHCCTPPGENPGENATVVWGFFGLPFNDILPPSIAVTPFTTGVGGVFTSVWNDAEGSRAERFRPNSRAFSPDAPTSTSIRSRIPPGRSAGRSRWSPSRQSTRCSRAESGWSA